jgi:hypothetical protein
VPIELKRELFTALTNRIGAQLDAAGATEEEILADFAEWRASRHRHC